MTMRLPAIRGMIDRRILVNYRVDADVAARLLPPPFRPRIINGYAMAGICLIRLKQIRPAWIPFNIGIGSENAAHRFAVEWERDGQLHQGVFIPRRDSSSRLNVFVGGRIFPGVHHRAQFEVSETADRFQVSFKSDDGQSHVSVTAQISTELPANSVFKSMDDASRFFETGAVGYSATRDKIRYDGLELRCKSWAIQPLVIESVQSSYYEDRTKFPEGSSQFDNALLMRQIDHQWHSCPDLSCCDQRAGEK